jgi:hypothetical protein
VSEVLAIAGTDLTAGGYLRLRREAAGLSIRAIAVMASSAPIDRAAAIEALTAAEENREPLASADIHRIAHFLPIAANIYLSLAQGLSVSDVCLRCGCSWDDACEEVLSGCRCAWANPEKSLCTFCARKAQ